MADFPCFFINPPVGTIFFLPAADPINYGAVIMPFTATQDQIAPTVTVISPPLGNMGRYSTVVLRISDELQLVRVNLWVEYSNGNAETIYGRGQFMRRFRAGSTIETILVDRQVEMRLRPSGGWPSGALDFQIEAIDFGGNVSV